MLNSWVSTSLTLDQIESTVCRSDLILISHALPQNGPLDVDRLPPDVTSLI